MSRHFAANKITVKNSNRKYTSQTETDIVETISRKFDPLIFPYFFHSQIKQSEFFSASWTESTTFVVKSSPNHNFYFCGPIFKILFFPESCVLVLSKTMHPFPTCTEHRRLSNLAYYSYSTKKHTSFYILPHASQDKNVKAVLLLRNTTTYVQIGGNGAHSAINLSSVSRAFL